MNDVTLCILLTCAFGVILTQQMLWVRAQARLTERLEAQRGRDWNRLISIVAGIQETVELRGLDPEAKSLVEAAQDEGLDHGDTGGEI